MKATKRQPYDEFDALIGRHRQLINDMCLRYADGNANRSVELVQDCYLAIWRYLPSLREDASPLQERLWVFWHCRSVFSRQRKQGSPTFLPLDDNMADTLVQPDDDSLSESIEAMAEVLTPYERQALRMMAEGYTIREMARELGIQYGSSAKLRQRIYDKLRRHFNPDYNTTKHIKKGDKKQ